MKSILRIILMVFVASIIAVLIRVGYDAFMADFNQNLIEAKELSFRSEVVPKVDPENDEFDVLLVPNREAISCFHEPSQFYVILKNKSDEPKRLFEFWNSFGYQNISFYFHMADGVHVVTRKDQDFTRNFPSTYEVPAGEAMVFPMTFDEWWHELPNIAEGESKVKVQVVYKCDPDFDAKDAKAWTGIAASKVYEVNFWRAHASTLNRHADQQTVLS